MKSGMMMFQKQATVFVALILGMVLMIFDTANACSCLSLPGLCDYYDMADVVMHAKVVSRSSGSSTDSDSSSIFVSPTTYEYTIDIITVYKNDPEIVYDEQTSFFTSSSSAACGISPNIDGEYLLGLYWSEGSSDSTGDGQLRANLCGLYREWSTVDEDELEGCSTTSDACDGACDEFEECLQYEKNEEWYCSEICADGACDVGESCKTKSRFWCKFSSYDGCPQRRVCY